MTSLIVCFAVASFGDPTSTDIVQTKFQDVSFMARIATGNQQELAKINKDFGNSYRFKFTKAFIKEPFKLRLETTVDDTDVVFIVNHFIRHFKVPRAGIDQRENLAKKPGKLQTLLDFGLITPSLLSELFKPTYVRTERGSGDLVFDLTYKLDNGEDTSRHRVWVDPKKRYVKRREWYNQSNRQLATFIYEKPVAKNGVWFPTRVSVRNNDNVVAGVTNYEKVKLNEGLADSLFELK